MSECAKICAQTSPSRASVGDLSKGCSDKSNFSYQQCHRLQKEKTLLKMSFWSSRRQRINFPFQGFYFRGNSLGLGAYFKEVIQHMTSYEAEQKLLHPSTNKLAAAANTPDGLAHASVLVNQFGRAFQRKIFLAPLCHQVQCNVYIASTTLLYASSTVSL